MITESDLPDPNAERSEIGGHQEDIESRQSELEAKMIGGFDGDVTAGIHRDAMRTHRVMESSYANLAARFDSTISSLLGPTLRSINDLVDSSPYQSIEKRFLQTQSQKVSDLILNRADELAARSTALMQSETISRVMETLGSSAADRAAFSLNSGLRASDSVASVVDKLMADTDGIGIARSALAATLGESLEKSGVTVLDSGNSAIRAALSRGLGPMFDNTSLEAALFQSGAMRHAVNELAGVNVARTRVSAMRQLVASSGIAELIGDDRVAASWRQSLLAEATARSLIGTMAVPEGGASLLRDIVGANTATARVVGRYSKLHAGSGVSPVASARPTRELRAFLSRLPIAPNYDDLNLAVRASRSVAGFAAADLLVADGTLEDEGRELLEDEIVEPWLNGPETLRALLFSRLGALDEHVPDLLRGAWTQVEENGPAATSMASHALQEALDRTLRALAPAELVLRLFVAGRIPKNSVYEKSGNLHPTRAGRIAAALHERHPGEAGLISAQAKAIAASVTYVSESLQGGKHASNGSAGLVRTWLVSVEATFTQLLHEPGDG